MHLRLATICFALCVCLASAFTPNLFAQDPAAPPPAESTQPADTQPGAATPPADGAAPAGNAAETAPAPAQGLDKYNDQHSMKRLPHPTIYWLKLLTIWVIFLLWVKSADWVNRDAQIFNLGHNKWNPILFFPFFLVVLIFVFPFILGLANYWAALGGTLVVYLATFIPYVVTHNKSLPPHQRVFTSDWFRYEYANIVGKIGIKVDAERKADWDKGPAVDLMAVAAPQERENQANLVTARQSPGYLLVKELLADMVDRRSDKCILDYTQQSVVARHHIDGVWHNGDARDRESGDVMLAVMKTLANLSATERRKKQDSKFACKYNGHSFVCPISSQGVPTGERVVIELLGGQQQVFKHYPDLGMRPKMAEQWAECLAVDKGLIVISAMPEGGLTTLTDISLMETDRLLRDFVAIEEASHRDREIENIDVTTYDAKKGETAASIIPAMIRKYPNAYVMRDFSEPEATKILINEVRDEDRLVVTTARAKTAAEALLRLLQQKVPQKEFASVVTAVICTRLIRKLCDACKVGYTPTPEMLKKLGIPAGKVEALYRTPKPEEIEKPCKECANVGYKGRTGLFELLVVDDKIREILVKAPKLELLTKAARMAGMRTFQEEGLLLIAKGVTSIPELQRVLKE